MKRAPIQYNVFGESLGLLEKEDSYFTDPKNPNFKKSPRWFTQESDPCFYYPYVCIDDELVRWPRIDIGKDTTVYGGENDWWGLESHNNNLKTILNIIMSLVNKDEYSTEEVRTLHLSRVNSMEMVPYIVYSQHLLNEMDVNIQLSFSSSYPSDEAMKGKFIQFCTTTGIHSTIVSEMHDWPALDRYSHLGCDCPICKDVTDLPLLFADKEQLNLIISLHNFYKVLQYKRVFEGLISFKCQGVIESLPLDTKRNFISMKKAFGIMGEGGLSVIENEIKSIKKTGTSGDGLSKFMQKEN